MKTVELVPVFETSVGYDEDKERRANYEKWSDKFTETRVHRLVHQLGESLRSIYPFEETLSRLGPNWPAGKSVDHLVPSRRLAFLYDTDLIEHDRGAEAWCQENDYELIRVSGSHAVKESSMRSLLRMDKVTESKKTLDQSLSEQGHNTLLLGEAQAYVDAVAEIGMGALIDLLSHPYWLVRNMTCEALMDADYMPACSSIAKLLKDENQSVRRRAQEALESIHRTTFTPEQVMQIYHSVCDDKT